MKNRAKCKLCNSTVESFHDNDYVLCKCGHISVSGGDAMYCSAIDWANFVRVDDVGNEILVTITDKEAVNPIETQKPNKAELLGYLDEMIKSCEALPEHAKTSPITHYDHVSLMILLAAIIRSE